MSAPKKTRSRPAAAKKKPAVRRARSKALAVSDPVRHQEIGLFRTSAFTDNQVALFGALARWSPAHFFARQQAAFWEGFIENGSAPSSRSGGRRASASRSEKSRRSARSARRSH